MTKPESANAAPVDPRCSAGPWRCFFCDELIATREEALQHFGAREISKPACQYDVAEMREMERELAMYREEDTALHREIARLQSKIETVRMRAEEEGYTRGLRDAKRRRFEMSEANEEGKFDCGSAPLLSADERQALEWARQTPHQSVAARYAKSLAAVVDRLTNAMDAMPQVAVDVAADEFRPSDFCDGVGGTCTCGFADADTENELQKISEFQRKQIPGIKN